MAYNAVLKHFVTRLDGGVIWAPSTQYASDDVVVNGNMIYRAVSAHTSAASFATDLAAGRWTLLTGGGYVVYNSLASPATITAAGGITVSTTDQRQMRFVQGNGAGLTTVSANPQISAGATVGQELVLFGSSDANVLRLSNGTGLGLNGSIDLVQNTMLSLVWNGSVWSETSRNN